MLHRSDIAAVALAACALASGCSSRPARHCDGVECSGYGSCMSDGEEPVCVCVPGFVPQGLTCVANTGCAGVRCSGHGVCVEQGGRAEGCECDPGYGPSPDGFHCTAETAAPDAGPCADGDGDGVSPCDGDCDDENPFIRRCDCLAVGNNGEDRVYRRAPGEDALSLGWTSDESHNTTAVAWADVDGDGLDDLAVGTAGGQPLMIYENEGGRLAPGWSSSELDATQAVAWADWDQDGDMDLAVASHDALGTGETVRIYDNDGGDLQLLWTSTGAGDACALAWGDWDQDGDEDLAVGMCSGLTITDEHPNLVYRNEGGSLELAWRDSAHAQDDTRSVAWADTDGNGSLELAVGNGGDEGGENRLFRRAPEGLVQVWSSTERDDTLALAWGDWDGDGTPDLAVANDGDGSPNRIYGLDGTFFSLMWTSDEADRSRAMAWGDPDRDGAMELAVGNTRGPNRLYSRSSGGGMTLRWSSSETDSTRSLSWGQCGF